VIKRQAGGCLETGGTGSGGIMLPLWAFELFHAQMNNKAKMVYDAIPQIRDSCAASLSTK
jgi:hypothetical protein